MTAKGSDPWIRPHCPVAPARQAGAPETVLQVVDLKKSAAVDDINRALEWTAEGKLKGVRSCCDEPLVSSDFRAMPVSSIVDALSTVVLDDKGPRLSPDTTTREATVVASVTWQREWQKIAWRGSRQEGNMIAKNIMTRDVITVSPTLTVKSLAALLIKNQISGTPVVGKNGKIIGVVSESDIVAKKGRDVKAIMSKNLITVSEETPVEKIARLMTRHNIKRLPVMKGDKVVGIVSRADIVSAIALGKHLALHTPAYDL